MRILFLSDGSSIHTVRWVNTLANRGNEVHLVYKFNDFPKTDNIDKRVIQHRLKYGGTKGYFLNARYLNKLYKKIKPDVVNTHYASGYGTLARLAKLRPLVLSVWGSDVYDFPYQSKLNMKILLKNLNYADQIASTSISMADQVRKLLKNENFDIKITPFGVDTDIFSKKEMKKNNDKIVIGLVKSLENKYGIKTLIKAIDLLIKNLNKKDEIDIAKKIQLDIYGDGSLKDELIEMIESKKLEDIVFLKGRIPNTEVPNALNEFDIFCATSEIDSESFGVALVEAMAVELPSVVTDVSGFKEVCSDGQTGIVVEKKSVSAIAEGLERLVLNENLRNEMGKNARKRVLQLYDWNNNVDSMIEIYKEVINK
ncbi:MAG: hypothetical protein CSB16_00925 [Clostridiales bacterium]|nr:MAG: hypothetical protein CSB16_00925 [Clostridiales bacterium]